MLRLTNIISSLFGRVTSCWLPPPFDALSVAAFSKLVGIELDEYIVPAKGYRTIAELFTRRLKPGSRPIGAGIISPVDGKLRDQGILTSDRRLRVKGAEYSVAELLGEAGLAAELVEASYWNIYLAPHNYHHIHAPIDATVQSIRLIPGSLLPVNDWSVRRFPELFTRNERMIFELRSDHGITVMVLVGALNVGSITTVLDATLRSNSNPFGGDMSEVAMRHPLEAVEKGALLATFNLGSTVVLFHRPNTAAPTTTQFASDLNNKAAAEGSSTAALSNLRMGEALPS